MSSSNINELHGYHQRVALAMAGHVARVFPRWIDLAFFPAGSI
jgi:hypothetical protein